MDTKWKKRKTAVSFGVFFLSVSLLLSNGAVFFKEVLDTGSFASAAEKMVEQDYQNTASFRRCMQAGLSQFLAMAVGGHMDGYFDGDGVYWGSGDDYGEEDITGFTEYIEYSVNEGSAYGLDKEDSSSQKKAKNLLQAKAYHEEIRRDKNLLYRIADGEKELYSNMDGILWDADSGALPKGYNFRLDFNGEKVSVRKDGKDQDVYGDGYYRGGDQWYVPGYHNFLADEQLKTVKITMLAAADPVSYSYAGYKEGSFMLAGNRLYEIAESARLEHNSMCRAATGMAAGVVLFALYLCMRKEKRAADQKIAQFTGNIWFEAKLAFLLMAAGMCGLLGYAAGSVSSVLVQDAVAQSGTAMEQAEAFGNTYDFSIGWLEEPARLTAFLAGICSNPGVLLVCFWAVYLFVNDLLKNRGHFLDGCFRRLIQRARTDTLKQPFAVQQMRRVLLPAAAGTLAVLAQMAVMGILFAGGFHRAETVCIQFLIAAILLGVLSRCLLGAKRQAQDLDLLAEQIYAVQSGDYTEKEDLSADSSLKPLSDSLSKIRRGMETAVAEQLKSERMKVELVANVSHDLKTPLTSIISYLAFLKQEEGLPEHVQDYIRILDQKAGRLNSIVQDVFAISKAASGQLPVELKELDFGKLLRQTLADMQEQIQAGTVTFKAEIPQEAVMIRADGTRLYRVFQNLIQNALQYSLEGSRVFVDLEQEHGTAAASIKNISRQELRFGPDFTERFVRGDESRTDGGAGLGLSIAKSFTEACGGSFSLETDADLFAVRVCFQVVRRAEALHQTGEI